MTESFRLIADKTQLPPVAAGISRPRLLNLLSKSLHQFGAAIVSGRSGTGKTSLVAEFARKNYECAAWYKVESADEDWAFFSSYLITSLNKQCGIWQKEELQKFVAENFNGNKISTESIAAWMALAAADKPLLVVLDDAHCVYDAEWFSPFFQTLLPLLSPNVHLLLLARSLPPLPLWRMRSKQVLGVIDENLLAFTPEETAALFKLHGLSDKNAQEAHKQAYGRAAKLLSYAETSILKQRELTA